MDITLITPEIYDELLLLQADNPSLTFQNVGYQYLGPEVRTRMSNQISRISHILREHVVGFSEFFNFKLSEDGSVVIRLSYNWGAEDNSVYFTGVGYLKLEHLMTGFPSGATQA